MVSPYIDGAALESAVAIVLIDAPHHPNAMTVSFFSEVAHHPTALWVAISPNAYSHSLLEEARRFSISVLNQKQAQIAIDCGTVSGRDVDKCSRLNLYETSSGFLFLHGALASTGCVLRSSTTVGDHTLFVADIAEAELESRSSHLRHLLLSDL